MTYDLVIAEKPSAAKKIADALSDSKPVKKSEKAVPYYLLSHNKKDIVVVPAVGHLYTVAEKLEKGQKKKWTYPIFNTEWVQTSQIDKGAAYSSKYVSCIKKLAKDAKSFTVACDYDIEGETIGFNIVRFACKQKDANRMKFSTLTKDELRKSYDEAASTLNWGQANAGSTRHVLDYYYGINLSRALSLSIKAVGSFKILSSGRVQGPALKIVVDRELEIQAFKPVPYWQLELKGTPQAPRQPKDKDTQITALHKEEKFWDQKKATDTHKKVKGEKTGTVEELQKRQFQQKPPAPFDLTSLQLESYRSMKISPKETLALAQQLYLKGVISYPRTSSQQLPPEIGFEKILKQLQNQDTYAELAKKLLAKGAKNLKPNNGKKKDAAHPAIYPTGLQGEILEREAKVYDIIVRRFMATFADPATRETATMTIGVAQEPFIAKGTRTVEKGWHVFYGHHVKLEEEELPQVEKGDIISVKKIDLLSKETQPPKRYTPASIIKELEARGLGTKATRAAIVDAILKRGYVINNQGKSFQATDLGIKVCETLSKYCPEILDEALTRHFEEEMDEIREKKKKGEDVLKEAEGVLRKLLDHFKENEKKIGQNLLDAHVETRDKQNYLGQCIKCDKGKLGVRTGKFGRFAACDGYPDCKTTYSLPNKGIIKASEEKCEACKFILIQIRMPRKSPQKICLSPDCPSKKISKADEKLEKPCEKCAAAGRQGKLIVRKSVYGSFLGCTSYPKCRNNEPLPGNEKKEAPKEA